MSGVPQQAPPRIVDVVLGPPPPRPSGRLAIALLIGIGVHVALVAYALNLAHDDETQPEARNDKPYEVEPPPEPPKPPAPTPPAVVPPPETQPAPHMKVARAPHEAPPAAAQPPAQAGKVIGQEADPDAPVDLSGDVVVTGSGTAFAGGKTTTGGTSKKPVDEVVKSPVAEGPVRKGKPAPPPVDHSHPVGLPDDDWSCPWPREAEEADVDEEVALIRVVVAIDGRVESTSIVRDPGHGFGAAAMVCARGTRFTPAADRQGLAIRAQSPPVRVRFVR